MLFAMLMNLKETGVNGGRQRDYLGSILQYKNILVFLLLFSSHLLHSYFLYSDESHCPSRLTRFAPVVLAP